MPQFAPQQSIAGAGGGVAAGIRNYLLGSANVHQNFIVLGGGIYTGELPKLESTVQPKTQKKVPQRWPSITIYDKELGFNPELYSDRFVIERCEPMVKVYAVGEDAADWHGRYVGTILLNGRDQMFAYGFAFTLIPMTGWRLAVENDPSEMAGPVWCYSMRFSATTGRALV